MILDGGLEVLDSSDADVDTLTTHAASILSIEFSGTKLNSDFTERTARASDFSFKEQWVLRWLTRKVHAEVQAANKNDGDVVPHT